MSLLAGKTKFDSEDDNIYVLDEILSKLLNIVDSYWLWPLC